MQNLSMITQLRCILDTGSLDCTKYAARACVLYQLAERRLTEMTRGCLDTELSALIHNVSLAGRSRQLERKRESRGDMYSDREKDTKTGPCRGGINDIPIRFMGDGDKRTEKAHGKRVLLALNYVLNYFSADVQ